MLSKRSRRRMVLQPAVALHQKLTLCPDSLQKYCLSILIVALRVLREYQDWNVEVAKQVLKGRMEVKFRISKYLRWDPGLSLMVS